KGSERRATAARVHALPRTRRRRGRPTQGRARRPRGGASARGAAGLARRSACMSDVAETAIVFPGTVIGEGCKILDYAVVGKLPPLELGAGTVVSTGAVVFAGTTVGERVIVGDQACVRERCSIGDDVVIGRGSLVENDTRVGALTKIQ